MALVNPVSAYGLLDVAQHRGAKAVVSTAAAGALGRMIARLGARRGVGVINVVRRHEQVDSLHQEGREHVLDSSDPELDRQLEELCRRLDARVALDAIGGPMTGRLLHALPPGGHVVIYGGLSFEPASFDSTEPIYQGKSVSGFYLPAWLATKNALSVLLIIGRRVAPLLRTELSSKVRHTTTLDEAPAAIARYADNMTAGKVLITPNPR
jgi:NADPH:quinone reductase-like Zn-dependent oxidoreductase